MAVSSSKPILNEARMDFLRSKNLAGLVRLSNVFVPRIIKGFLPKLSPKQQAAFDKVMPPGGQKQIAVQLVGSPTPPIVVTLAQPLIIEPMSEEELSNTKIKCMKIHLDDLPALVEIAAGTGDIFGALKSLKGQKMAMLSLMSAFTPLLSLGAAEIRDLKKRAQEHFKPVAGMLPF